MANNAKIHRLLFFSTLVWSIILSSALTTLNSVKELQENGFNCPPARHGLRLLAWYVKNCVNHDMLAKCDPSTGEYGFKSYWNWPRPVLPVIKGKKYTYYVIGDLKSSGGKKLPYEVRKYYDSEDSLSNMDRVVVKYNHNNRHVEEVFVTADLDKKQTYLVSPKLITALRQPEGGSTIPPPSSDD